MLFSLLKYCAVWILFVCVFFLVSEEKTDFLEGPQKSFIGMFLFWRGFAMPKSHMLQISKFFAKASAKTEVSSTAY